MTGWIILGIIGVFALCFFCFIWGTSKGMALREEELQAEMIFLRQLVDGLRKDNAKLEAEKEKLEEDYNNFEERRYE
jgi:hypothetical protein